MQKKICILTLYLFIFALNLLLHRFRNELARSLTNGNYFSSIYMYIRLITRVSVKYDEILHE